MGLIDKRRKLQYFSLFFFIAVPVFAQQGAVSIAAEISRLEKTASGLGAQAARRNAYSDLIKLYQLSGNSEAAIKTCEGALSSFPGEGRFLLEHGRLLFSLGEYDKAASIFNTLKNNSNREFAKQGRLLSAKLEAFRSSPEALTVLSGDPEFLEQRSDIYFTLWKLTSAAVWKNKLTAEFPQSPEAKMASGGINLNPSPLWLLFPGRENVVTAGTPSAAPQTVIPPVPPSAVTPQSAATPQTAPAQNSAGERYLQTGLFGREENAKAFAERLRKAGFAAQLNKRVVNDNDFWAVLVPGGADMNATMNLLKNAGFESFPLNR